ncbi:MAG: hypothetical protein Fur0042_01760 [Cyanophyceae cyanobacterium]
MVWPVSSLIGGLFLGISVATTAIASPPPQPLPGDSDPMAILEAVDRELPCPDPPTADMPNDSLTLLGRGFWQLCTDQVDAAIATFETLLTLDPVFAEGFDVDALLGHALRRRGDWDAAIAVYQRVVDRGGDPASGAQAALGALQRLLAPRPQGNQETIPVSKTVCYDMDSERTWRNW